MTTGNKYNLYTTWLRKREGRSVIISSLREQKRSLNFGLDLFSYVVDLFCQTEEIWDDQCRYASKLIEDLIKPISEIQKLIESPCDIPYVV